MPSITIVSIRRQGGVISTEEAIRVARAVDDERALLGEADIYDSGSDLGLALVADTYGERDLRYRTVTREVMCGACGHAHTECVTVTEEIPIGVARRLARMTPGYFDALERVMRAAAG